MYLVMNYSTRVNWGFFFFDWCCRELHNRDAFYEFWLQSSFALNWNNQFYFPLTYYPAWKPEALKKYWVLVPINRFKFKIFSSLILSIPILYILFVATVFSVSDKVNMFFLFLAFFFFQLSRIKCPINK